MKQVIFTITNSELITLTRQKQLRWLYRLYWVAGALFILLVAFGLFTGNWEGFFSYCIPIILIIVIFEWLWPRMMNRQLKKIPTWGKPVSYTFEEEHILQKSASAASVMQWTAFQKAEEMENWFLLYIGPMVYLPIPKRAFESADEMAAFRQLLAQKALLK